MNAEAREDLRQMLLEQLDVERSEYDGAQDALRAMDPDKVMDEGYVQVANRNRAAERIQKLKNAMAELEYLHQAKETSPEETTPEELTQELAFLDSTRCLLEAGPTWPTRARGCAGSSGRSWTGRTATPSVWPWKWRRCWTA